MTRKPKRKTEKMWDGRFQQSTHPEMDRLNCSLPVDCRLYNEDITASMAWAKALQRAGILSARECQGIRKALQMIRQSIASGKANFLDQDEDIHMAVERLLVKRVGSMGYKIHTGRSRNDQVATDERLFLLHHIPLVVGKVREIQAALLKQAVAHQRTLLSGYTHLQQAQPVSLSHYLLAFLFALERDAERLEQARQRCSVLPLGSGALAGSAFRIDRKKLAQELGFAKISDNSMDAVSDRDFILDVLSAASILMMHLSRLSEDLIIWSSAEFGFCTLSDAYATGSSMMPQKKNPDSLELVRGKAGRTFGNLMQLLSTMKGLPSTYAKDMQEDKEPLFDTLDTLNAVLPVMAGTLRTLVFDERKMRSGASEMLLATELADHLAGKKIPFREGHRIVGRLTRYCLEKGKTFSQLSAPEWKRFSPHFGSDPAALLSLEASLKRRNVEGGTGPQSVARQIKKAQGILKRARGKRA